MTNNEKIYKLDAAQELLREAVELIEDATDGDSFLLTQLKIITYGIDGISTRVDVNINDLVDRIENEAIADDPEE